MEGNLSILNFDVEEMKKIIFNIIILIGIVFILDFAIGRILRYFYFRENSGFQFHTTYSMDSTKADILVFGASRANHHYVPEVFEDSLEMSFYNTGRDGVPSSFFSLAILKSILKRYTPKVIILDYNGSSKEEEDYDRLSCLLPYYKTHQEIRKIIALKSPFERVKLLSEIYPFNSEIFSIVMGNLEINKKRYPDSKGYIPLYGKWQNKIDSIISKTYTLDSNKITSLQNFVKIAKESGAKVFVIYSPIFKEFNINPEINVCNKICSFQNIPFWNFSNDSLFLNNKNLFQDPYHLNHEGATIFSKIIVHKMKEYVNKARR